MKAIYPFLIISLFFVVWQNCPTTPLEDLPKGIFLGELFSVDAPIVFGQSFISTPADS